MLPSCSDSKVEKELDGQWNGEAVIEDDEDNMLTLKMYLTLEEASHEFNMKTNILYPMISKIAVMRFGGTWKADSDFLTMDIEENSIKVKFDDDISILAQMGGMDVDLLKRQMEQELKDEISGFTMLEIKSLSYEQMTLDIFDTNGFFTKISDDDAITPPIDQ